MRRRHSKTAGPGDFYPNVVDDQKRHPEDNPSLGVILCQTEKRLVAEYALRGMTKAMGAANTILPASSRKSSKAIFPPSRKSRKNSASNKEGFAASLLAFLPDMTMSLKALEHEIKEAGVVTA